ncbi:MAG: secretin and TonB N-terminal domain-containing protein, partial [Planctomycetaceae bacterium]|nr:secretin and TonB N-terminal domain-containing protein [Planctomycetaceae bacterium]
PPIPRPAVAGPVVAPTALQVVPERADVAIRDAVDQQSIAASGPAEQILTIPFSKVDTPDDRRNLELSMNDGLITLMTSDAALSDIFAILATDHGLNIVTSEAITERVTVNLRDVPLADALNVLLSVNGLTWTRRNNIIVISRTAIEQPGGAIVQGRVIRVYPLSFVSASDAESVITGLLSPVGSVRSMMSSELDSRKSRDQLIVEDVPDYLERVDQCISQLDQPPLQVEIQAQILEVELSADNRHGVNLEALSDVAGTSLSLQSPGFASSTTSPSFLFGLDGSQLDGLLEALKTTADARTLASPRVLVTHGQQAHIQVGGRVGYRQSTTTQTSTIQGVEFLDVGVELTVTPYIGENGQILLKVNPEVSDGELNLQTQLPDERITTVESTVLLNDSQGMIIGGLIREIDSDRRNKAPFLGESWMLGRLFQSVRHEQSRREVIIAIQPRIVRCPFPTDVDSQIALDRVTTPLFHNGLARQYRPWEPELPEVLYRPQDAQAIFGEFRQSEGARLKPLPNPRSGPGFFEGADVSVPRSQLRSAGFTETRPGDGSIARPSATTAAYQVNDGGTFFSGTDGQSFASAETRQPQVRVVRVAPETNGVILNEQPDADSESKNSPAVPSVIRHMRASMPPAHSGQNPASPPQQRSVEAGASNNRFSAPARPESDQQQTNSRFPGFPATDTSRNSAASAKHDVASPASSQAVPPKWWQRGILAPRVSRR